MAEFVAVDEDVVMLIPKNMSFTDAAAIPEVWLTSFQLLHLVGENRQLDKFVCFIYFLKTFFGCGTLWEWNVIVLAGFSICAWLHGLFVAS